MSNVATILEVIAQNQPKIYSAGYEKGKSEGGTSKESRPFAEALEVLYSAYKPIKNINGVKYIDDCAVGFDNSQSSVSLQPDTTQILEEAFYNCSNLKTLYIPQTVEIVGARAFEGTNITSYYENGAYYLCDNQQIPTVFLKPSLSDSIISHLSVASTTRAICSDAFKGRLIEQLEIPIVLDFDDITGRNYKWFAHEKGIIAFKRQDTTYDLELIHNGKTIENVPDSISVNPGEMVTITVKPSTTNISYPNVNSLLTLQFIDGSYGQNLANNIGDTAFGQSNCSPVIVPESVGFIANTITPKIQLSLPVGHKNTCRYLAIVYKSNGFIPTDSYYFAAKRLDNETTIKMSEQTKFQHRKFAFTNDNEWHALIIDTQEYMTGTSVNKEATHDGSQYQLTALRFNFNNIKAGSELTLKGIELSDNKAFLENKYAAYL